MSTTETENPAKRGAPKLCGHVVLVDGKDRKCGLKPGHEGPHKPREKKSYDTSGLDTAFLAQPFQPTEAEKQVTAPARARSDEQRAVDNIVKALHEQWVAAGRPFAWAKMPTRSYPLDPRNVSGVKYMIRRAGELHGHRIKFGTDARMTEKAAADRGHPEWAGRQLVSFAVLDRRAKDAKPASATTPAPAAPAPAAPAPGAVRRPPVAPAPATRR